MAKNSARMFAPIEKTEEMDDGTIKVWGYASAPTEDSDGEIITADAMKAALPDYLKFGAVREMHGKSAAGTAIEAEVQDDGRTWFGAHVVDPVAVTKVRNKVYKGFSIGGRVTSRDDVSKTTITGLKLVEVSLVDRPANPDAVFTMFKAESELSAIDEMAKMVNDGVITPERLLELAKSDLDTSEDGAGAPAAVAGTDDTEKAADDADAGAAADCDANAGGEVATKADEGAFERDRAGKPPVKVEGEAIKKGMWQVSRFAELLNSLSSMASDAAWEASYEGDNSPVPAKLRDWLDTGAGIFGEMAAEEVAEMLACLSSKVSPDAVVEMADDVTDLAKAGARHSKKDAAAMQSAHDALVAMGASCGEADKAATGDDLAKVEALTTERDEAVAKAAGLATEVETLAKRVKELEDQPVTAKAILKVIEKAQDAILASTPEIEPVRKHDGTVDESLTLFKAALARPVKL